MNAMKKQMRFWPSKNYKNSGKMFWSAFSTEKDSFNFTPITEQERISQNKKDKISNIKAKAKQLNEILKNNNNTVVALIQHWEVQSIYKNLDKAQWTWSSYERFGEVIYKTYILIKFT